MLVMACAGAVVVAQRGGKGCGTGTGARTAAPAVSLRIADGSPAATCQVCRPGGGCRSLLQNSALCTQHLQQPNEPSACAPLASLRARCADPAAVAAALRLLGRCLRLLLLPPPMPEGQGAAPPQPPGATGSAAPALPPPLSPPLSVSEAPGWRALLDHTAHPHPVVRCACLDAMRQVRVVTSTMAPCDTAVCYPPASLPQTPAGGPPGLLGQSTTWDTCGDTLPYSIFHIPFNREGKEE